MQNQFYQNNFISQSNFISQNNFGKKTERRENNNIYNSLHFLFFLFFCFFQRHITFNFCVKSRYSFKRLCFVVSLDFHPCIVYILDFVICVVDTMFMTRLKDIHEVFFFIGIVGASICNFRG